VTLATVTVVDALAVGSAALVAVTMCVQATAGAVKMTVLPAPGAVMAPTVALPLATPSTLQVTAVLLDPVTAAVNSMDPVVLTRVRTGTGRLTTTGDVTLTKQAALLVPSKLLEVAVTMWLPPPAGAV